MSLPYSYELPEARIAQRPVHPYDAAKLLLVNRGSGEVTESTFKHIAQFLKPNDLLLFNNTRVIPARFFGMFRGTGGKVEVLLLEHVGDTRWVCLGRPLKRFKEDSVIEFERGLNAKVIERRGTEKAVLEFISSEGGDTRSLMESVGVMPIPPYIRDGRADESDRTDYQTFFAEREGSIAAPTASLHFTPELLKGVRELGCRIEYLTLHVGAASFLPLMHEHDSAPKPPGVERYFVDSSVLDACIETKKSGGRVIPVGTTVVRALESMASLGGELKSADQSWRETKLFIEPGYKFKMMDALITNFHQPRTTHLLLVESLMGRDLLDKSYGYAMSHDFRFLSYGDGMLIF